MILTTKWNAHGVQCSCHNTIQSRVAPSAIHDFVAHRTATKIAELRDAQLRFAHRAIYDMTAGFTPIRAHTADIGLERGGRTQQRSRNRLRILQGTPYRRRGAQPQVRGAVTS